MNVHFSFNGKKSLKEGSRSERGGHCRKVSPHGSQKALLHKSDLQRGTASFEGVPAGSPSRGGNVAVYVFDINQRSLPTPFYSVLVSISVFMALSTVFHPINSPDSSSLSYSVFLVLLLPYWSFQLCISL